MRQPFPPTDSGSSSVCGARRGRTRQCWFQPGPPLCRILPAVIGSWFPGSAPPPRAQPPEVRAGGAWKIPKLSALASAAWLQRAGPFHMSGPLSSSVPRSSS
ncbi:hypothetical protein MC885_007725 [Smutsia gigantea]|nr:hypothetical protein MC885_007725 [Smutsia gigantea]